MQPKENKLGKGLSALFAHDTDLMENEKKIESNSPNGIVLEVPLQNIKPGPWQPRKDFNEAEIEALSASIKKEGILQPILVRKNPQTEGYEIIAGERRWRAAMRAHLHVVPVICKNVSHEEALSIALIENIQREDLSPIEEAEGYDRLMKALSHTQEELAVLLGKSRSHIANTLRLLQLPESIKKILINKEITAGHARCVIGLNEVLALQVIERIIRDKLNVRQVERLIKRNTPGEKDTAQSVKSIAEETFSYNAEDSEVRQLAQRVEEKIGLPTEIMLQRAGGKIIISFGTFADLDTFMEKISYVST